MERSAPVHYYAVAIPRLHRKGIGIQTILLAIFSGVIFHIFPVAGFIPMPMSQYGKIKHENNGINTSICCTSRP